MRANMKNLSITGLARLQGAGGIAGAGDAEFAGEWTDPAPARLVAPRQAAGAGPVQQPAAHAAA